MTLHPHSTSKLLPTFSTASSTSSDHHKLNRGSCTGLFFQLFDWNFRLQKRQLFRHKSLPAERPASSVPKNHNWANEKLRAAQMLSIADGGSVSHDLGSNAEDALRRDQTPEKKRKKRSPNVVAKLMGLETMPSPDLRREKCPIQCQHSMSVQNSEGISSLSNLRIPSSRRSLMEMERGSVDNCSSRWDFSTARPLQDPQILLNDNISHNKPCEAMTHKAQTCRFSTMVGTPSPTDEKNSTSGCVLSPSSSHNKMLLPVKSPMTSKATVSLFEAADRILEPSRQPKNSLTRAQVSRQVLPTGNNEKENGKAATQRKSNSLKNSSRPYPDNTAPHCGPKQDRKIDNTNSFPAASSNRRRALSSSATNGNTKEDAALPFGMNEKEKACLKRQEQTSRRLREVNSMKLQNSTPVIAKLERDPSPLRINTTLEHHYESHGISSTNSTLSTVTTQSKSISSIDAISRNKSLSSSGNVKRDKESKVKSDKTETRLDSLPAMKSLLTRRVDTMSFEGRNLRSKSTVSKCKDVDNKPSSRSKKQDAFIRSYISKDQIRESGSINEDISRFDDEFHDDRLNEASCCSIQNPDDVVDGISLPEIGKMGEDWEFSASTELTSTNVDRVNISSDLRITQNACRSSGVSSIDEVRDTASSCDINSAHTRKQTVSYSGKSTATILQELLSALNSSSKLSILENERIQQNSEVSGLTSTTIKTIENTLNASIGLTGDDSPNSLALSASSFNNYSQNSIEGSGRLSNREDLLLKDGSNKCWQSSLRSNLISFFHDQPCTGSENLVCMKERQGCCYNSSECICSITKKGYGERIDCEQISNGEVMSHLTESIIQSEEDYVKCIVNSTKLSPHDIYSAELGATEFINDPALFDKLEETGKHNWKWRKRSKTEVKDLYNSTKELDLNDEDMAREYRKLVFDCALEAVSLDVGIGVHSIQLLSNLYLPRQAHSRRVLKHIHDWKGVRCGIKVDDMVEKVMNTGAGKWIDFSSEFCEVAGEVGTSIVNALIEELVLDLSSCCRKVPVARTGKTQRLERNERKKLMWVGL